MFWPLMSVLYISCIVSWWPSHTSTALLVLGSLMVVGSVGARIQSSMKTKKRVNRRLRDMAHRMEDAR